MGEIRLPYRLSTSDHDTSPPLEKTRLGSPKSFLLRLFASSPPPEKISSSNNNIVRTSSSLSSGCFHTSRARLSDASFCMKLDFEEAYDTSSKPHEINHEVEEANKKIVRAAHWERKMNFLNSVNEVLSMEGRMVLKKMKKVMRMKEKQRKRKRNEGCQVWYEKEVKGIRCKPMRDGSFRIIRTAAVVQPAEEDGGVLVACEVYEQGVATFA